MKKFPHDPPQLFLRFFRWFCHPELKKYIEGDLIELHGERNKKYGARKADLKFIIDVLLLFRPGIIRPAEGHKNLNHYSMYKSYFKIGWRNLLRNKGYSFINISGLALGMSVAMLITFWIYDEVSFNKDNQNYDTVAKVYRRDQKRGEVFANTYQVTGLGTLLKSEYGAHFTKVVMIRANVEDRVVAIGEKKFTQNGYFMQPDGGELLNLKMKFGTRDGLKEMKSILLSESLARKLFGDADPVNQVTTMDAKWELKVTGVYEDLPKNSEFSAATYFCPLDLYLDGWATLDAWDNYHMNIYVQIHPDGDFGKISSTIKDAMLPHLRPEVAQSKPEVFLHPMSQWRLNSEFKDGVLVTSERMKFVWFYGTIGIFVLLLACINFMNLSTARSEKRAREVGIRKSIGSHRSQLIYQFFSESLLVSFLSFIVSLLLVALALPSFNAIADKNIAIPWTEPVFWMSIISFTVVTGILAGSYPALYLSSFNPVKVLKGTFKAGRFASLPRRILVITQFTVSISLTVGTVIVYQQIQFAKNRPIGYTREGLVSLHPRSPEFKEKYEVLRNELKSTGAVEEVAGSDYSITSTLGWNGGFEWKGKDTNIIDPTFNVNRVTHDYGKTIGWQFVSGRDFSREFPSDIAGVIINESAWKLIGLENPVGEPFIKNRNGERNEYVILGVVKDVVKGSPFESNDPCLYFMSEKFLGWIYLRINPQISPHDALPKIEATFNRVITSAPFDYKFADDEYEAKFRSEERVGTLAAIFSALAILISCSGLFGLASFVAEQRTREIGIRKVLGASILQVWRLLSSEFILLVLISCIVSIPLAYSLMDRWLQQYEYRTVIAWYVFAAAGLGSLLVTLLTVSIQAIRAAIANPVESLRSE